ncbi:hypothetical protein B0H63DRAFT_148513 [Podospora didyma]|uniref:PRKR-interacting protein 1 n=1 Tax=Podospora didyma TaxID=330526 RepID=A0AAE0NT08_9PEZI|nr:hypothetical protein B0H63DRAFT_148513 [Podospora didyma]
MSAPGPESIPLSADPRRSTNRPPSKRLKRDASPASLQAASVSALFAHPEQEIRLPPPPGTVARRSVAAPPEIVANVQGSSAGAGSGEFHVYKAARRREYERLRLMDEEVAAEKTALDFEAAARARAAADAEKTRRNREKREKKNKKKQAAVKGGGKGKAPSSSTTSTTTTAASAATAKGGVVARKDENNNNNNNNDTALAPTPTSKQGGEGGDGDTAATTTATTNGTAEDPRESATTAHAHAIATSARVAEAGLIIHDDD